MEGKFEILHNNFAKVAMRWIKHMTATPQDEKIARLIADHGHAGYGLWWLVVEAVAARLEGEGHPSVTYPVTKWSHLLSLRGSHVRQALLKLEVTHLVTVEWVGSEIRVTIPNLLKYRDEYSRKSGVAPDSVRSKKQKQKQNTEAEAETEKKQTLERAWPSQDWKSDEQYARFVADYLGTGAALVDDDFAEAWQFCWRTLDFEQKIQRVSSLNRHAEEYHADPRFVPRPRKFLEMEWQRPVKPPPAGRSPKSASLAERAIALMEKRIANGERPL